jgi:hypothetical protein
MVGFSGFSLFLIIFLVSVGAFIALLLAIAELLRLDPRAPWLMLATSAFIAAWIAGFVTWIFVRKPRASGTHLVIAGSNLVALAMLATGVVFLSNEPDPAGAPNSTPDIRSFPWPPPAPSSSYPIPIEMFAKYKTVGEVTDAIIRALESRGYVERSFYTAGNGGVVLVTRLESIAPDGTPLNPPDRWRRVIPGRGSGQGFAELVTGLFFATPGYYRVIVFVIGGSPFEKAEKPATEEQATAWLEQSVERLPREIADRPYEKTEGCTALTYEFDVHQEGKPSALKPGRLPAYTHLERSGLLAAFDSPQR